MDYIVIIYILSIFSVHLKLLLIKFILKVKKNNELYVCTLCSLIDKLFLTEVWVNFESTLYVYKGRWYWTNIWIWQMIGIALSKKVTKNQENSSFSLDLRYQRCVCINSCLVSRIHMNGYRSNYKYMCIRGLVYTHIPSFVCWESPARELPQTQQARLLPELHGEIIDTWPRIGKVQVDPEHLTMPKIKETFKKISRW